MAAKLDDSAAALAASDSVTVSSVVCPYRAKENVAWVFVLCCCHHIRFPRRISRLGEKGGCSSASGAVLGVAVPANSSMRIAAVSI